MKREPIPSNWPFPTGSQWVRFNPLTQSYETPDGTTVPAELADNVQSLADVLAICAIRERQRKPKRQAPVLPDAPF